MTQTRLEYLLRESNAERLSASEIMEIEDYFSSVPDSQFCDLRENAMASDMLWEIAIFHELDVPSEAKK